jgi:ADP-glucose pyrophosphorylase
MQNTIISEGISVNRVITDKFVSITHTKSIAGQNGELIYIKKDGVL